MWFEGPQTEWREYRGSESLREKSSAVLTKKRKKKQMQQIFALYVSQHTEYIS